MNDILQIATFIAAVIALAGVVYAFAFWRSKVDTQLSVLSKENIGERLVKIETKQEVMWTAFMEQVLTNRPNLAVRGSAFKLTDDAMKAVGEVQQLLPHNPGTNTTKVNSEHILIDLPNSIGLDRLKAIAEKHLMTLGELLAIISVELGIDI